MFMASIFFELEHCVPTIYRDVVMHDSSRICFCRLSLSVLELSHIFVKQFVFKPCVASIFILYNFLKNESLIMTWHISAWMVEGAFLLTLVVPLPEPDIVGSRWPRCEGKKHPKSGPSPQSTARWRRVGFFWGRLTLPETKTRPSQKDGNYQ